jgi:hypothetical protein
VQVTRCFSDDVGDPIPTGPGKVPPDLPLSPFNQNGSLGKAHQLIGDPMPKLLDELNPALAV